MQTTFLFSLLSSSLFIYFDATGASNVASLGGKSKKIFSLSNFFGEIVICYPFDLRQTAVRRGSNAKKRIREHLFPLPLRKTGFTRRENGSGRRDVGSGEHRWIYGYLPIYCLFRVCRAFYAEFSVFIEIQTVYAHHAVPVWFLAMCIGMAMIHDIEVAVGSFHNRIVAGRGDALREICGHQRIAFLLHPRSERLAGC